MVAISGLGKSTLAERHPGVVLDADRWIYEAVAMAFQDLEPRARLRAWRDLIHRWIEHKRLPVHKIGRLWKFKLSEVDEWVRADGRGNQSNR